MPYPAIWTRSQRGQISADYESVAFPGNTFIFLQKRRTQQCSFFRCAHCAKAMKLRGRRNATRLTVPIVRATLEDGFLDDPDNPLHRHFCIDEDGVDTSTFAAKARYIYNKVKLELLDMPMTPRQAWLQMKAEVIANFPDPTTQEEIISRLPSDKSAKRSFARRSSVGKRNLVGELAIISGLADEDMFGFLDGEEGEGDEDAGRMFELVQEDPRNIPLDLLKPSSQRPSWVCAPGREHLSNFFLIYRDFPLNGAPFMIFSDMMGINLLHKCPDIVCDGNSNFYPRGFSQLYTFHAVHESIPEEAHLCAFALLPNTAPITYLKLFDIISERLVIEYGEHGVKKNWHFDNQFAAINGCQAIFQTDNVEGSEERTASFAQLWHEHLHCLFFEPHPNLINFIQVMRDELARASAQAERIFPPSTTVKAINLDNIEAVNRFGEIKKQEEEQLFALNYPPTGGYHRQALLERHRFGTGAVFYNYPDLFVPPFYEQPRRGRPRKYPRDANGRPIRTPIQQQQFQAVTHRIRRPKVTWLPLAADKKEEEEEDSQQPCTSASAGLKPTSPPPQLVAAAEKASTNATSSFSSMATGNGKRQQQQPPVRKRPKIILQRVVVMENGVAEVEQPTEEDQQVEVDVEQLEPTVIEGLGKSNSLRGLGLHQQQQQQPAASSSAMPSRGMSSPAKEGNKTVAKRS